MGLTWNPDFMKTRAGMTMIAQVTSKWINFYINLTEQ